MSCSGCKKAARGAIGVAKAVMGLDQVSTQERQARHGECVLCDQFDTGMCKSCGCVVALKIRVGAEKCPLGKWGETGPKPTN